METITTAKAWELIQETNGKIFTAHFVKRTDNTVREMNCRTGVTKYVKGVGMAFNPKEHNLQVVFEMPKDQYRMINMDGLFHLTIAGQDYKIPLAEEIGIQAHLP